LSYQTNTIVVTFNYRVGALGLSIDFLWCDCVQDFLPCQHLPARTQSLPLQETMEFKTSVWPCSGWKGMHGQRRRVWVSQRNIAFFGGNPDRV
jgi:hypothetical protein